MDSREKLSLLFHFPTGVTIDSIDLSATELVIRIVWDVPSMLCPECQQPSARIHSCYQRIIADLPCEGRNMILALNLRTFICETSSCPCKIFTERLSGLLESYARMTSRLSALLQAIVLVAGVQKGTLLANRFAIVTIPSTLLHHLMQLPVPKARAVRVLRIDDFVWKKRFNYGTILVDLE